MCWTSRIMRWCHKPRTKTFKGWVMFGLWPIRAALGRVTWQSPAFATFKVKTSKDLVCSTCTIVYVTHSTVTLVRGWFSVELYPWWCKYAAELIFLKLLQIFCTISLLVLLLTRFNETHVGSWWYFGCSCLSDTIIITLHPGKRVPSIDERAQRLHHESVTAALVGVWELRS